VKEGVKATKASRRSLNLLIFAMLRLTMPTDRCKAHETRMMTRPVIFVALAGWLFLGEPVTTSAGSFDELTDFTGRVSPIVTMKGRDTFTSEYRYAVSVRNLTPDPIIADSLVLVLDKITNLAGQEREGLTGELYLDRFDILDAEGQTDDGKPYFRIPVGTAPDLAPQTESLPVSIRLRNRDYVAVFTPSFRVLGKKRPPPEPKRAETPAQPGQAQAPAAPGSPPSPTPMDKLIQLLIKKGVLTEEEWRKANRP
jgi:hypothetical protein